MKRAKRPRLHFRLEHKGWKAQRTALKARAQAVCNAVSVIARSETTKQSTTQLWIASPSSFAKASEDKSARNDDAWEVSILLADDPTLQQLNHDFRGKDKPTNVLSFPSDEPGYLGDIAISLDTLEREAGEQGKEFLAHFTHMTVHGMLHLLGFDHETEAEAEEMEQLEVEILEKFDIAHPYL